MSAQQRKWIIVCQGFANPKFVCPIIGQFLEWYRPNDPGDQNLSGWTTDLEKAMKFDSVTDAWATWNLERTVEKEPGAGRMFDDGKPNKPLTAFTVAIEEVVVDKDLKTRQQRRAAERKGLH